MTISHTVSGYLQTRHVPYDVVMHPYRDTAQAAARSAQVPPAFVAKAVVLADREGYLMAVIPSNRHVSLNALWKKTGRRLKLVPEKRLLPVFRDCARGAIPPLGSAYGMETIVDDSLVGLSHVYFECGDHCGLIHVSGEKFLGLLGEAAHGQFSH